MFDAPASSGITWARTFGLRCTGKTRRWRGCASAIRRRARQMAARSSPKLSRRWQVTRISARLSSPSARMPGGISAIPSGVSSRRFRNSKASTTVLPVTWTASGGISSAANAAAASWRRRKMDVGQRADQPAVDLFRKRIVAVVRAQAGLDMGDRHPGVMGRQRRDECRGGIALHDDAIRLCRGDGFAQARHQRGRQVRQLLPRLHDIQVDLRPQPEGIERLSQHFPMLAGGAHHGLELIPSRAQCCDDRRELDGFRSRPEHHHDFFDARAFRSWFVAMPWRCCDALPQVTDRERKAGGMGARQPIGPGVDVIVDLGGWPCRG